MGELLMIYLIFLTYILSELFDSQMDTIKFETQNAWSQLKWYLQDDWENEPLWLKTICSFALDGWHFVKALRIITIDIIATVLIQQYLHINFVLIVISLYIIHGIVFQTFYGLKP